MQHFQSILIFIGILAIGAVLIHGYYISRKEKAAFLEKQTDADSGYKKENNHKKEHNYKKENNHVFHDPIIDDEEFTDSIEDEQDIIDFSKALDDEDDETLHFNAQNEFDKPAKAKKVNRPDSDSVQYSSEFYEDSEEDNDQHLGIFGQDSETDFEDKRQIITPTKSKVISEHQKYEPVKKEPVKKEPQNHEPLKTEPLKTEPKSTAHKDFFVFNVVAKEGTHLRGSEILQFFITSGFRFGKNAIFHRHLYSNGTGPILFSIANMMEPGIFELDNMEQFVSEGISFFVVAPNPEIDIKQAFDLMLTAVQQMTDEFECVVLNAQRKPFTEQQFREDHERLMRYV